MKLKVTLVCEERPCMLGVLGRAEIFIGASVCVYRCQWGISVVVVVYRCGCSIFRCKYCVDVCWVWAGVGVYLYKLSVSVSVCSFIMRVRRE